MRVVVLCAVLSAAMTLGTGCASNRCENVCEQSNACSLTERPTDTDCTPLCTDVADFHKRAAAEGQQDCSQLWDEHLSCWESNSARICDTTFTDCADKRQAWTACMTTYCTALAGQGKTDQKCTMTKATTDKPATGKPTIIPF